jgi:hypothetical protein
MIMGGEVYLGDASTIASWTLGRQLGLQIAAHILSPFGIAPIFDRLAMNQLGNASRDVDPSLLLNRDRLQLDRAVRPTDQDVGADPARQLELLSDAGRANGKAKAVLPDIVCTSLDEGGKMRRSAALWGYF